jgi:hypothetical protein
MGDDILAVSGVLRGLLNGSPIDKDLKEERASRSDFSSSGIHHLLQIGINSLSAYS